MSFKASKNDSLKFIANLEEHKFVSSIINSNRPLWKNPDKLGMVSYSDDSE